MGCTGAEGTVLWNKKLGASVPFRSVLGFDLKTGDRKMVVHPVTGQKIPMVIPSHATCRDGVASANLVTKVGVGGGYYDLSQNHMADLVLGGGPRPECLANWMPANGVLSAPLTVHCYCGHPLRTSFSLVPRREVGEMWTGGWRDRPAGGAVWRAGINFGAPGARISDNGTLWMNSGKSGKIGRGLLSASFDANEPRRFYSHSSRLRGNGIKWVAASGLEGAGQIRIKLRAVQCPYTVRLHFAEPAMETRPGERVFNVSLQGKEVLKDFDVVTEAGGSYR